MINPKRYAVYYRNIPPALKLFVQRDGNMSMTKDGVYDLDGQACPRLTITVAPTKTDSDRDRLRKLEELLEELARNNHIAGYR